MNFPWDSYTSYEMLNEHADWWKAVSKRFVDTCRLVDSQRFRSVNSNGYIVGGDWYVISNGRQDYFNYYHNMREITMELSTAKPLSTTRLDHYWKCQSHALINYIKEIHHLDDSVVVTLRSRRLITMFTPTLRGAKFLWKPCRESTAMTLPTARQAFTSSPLTGIP
jgi:hypothetical protein